MTSWGNSPYPLSVQAVTEAFSRHALVLPDPVVKQRTASTNSDAVALAESGAPAWTVVVADEQSAGRGRLDRQWQSAPGDALLFSVVLRPSSAIPVSQLGWVPLLAGVATQSAIRSLGVDASLKWPNDVVVAGSASDGSAGPRKLGGILAERTGSAVVVGIGLNVRATRERLPIPAATSLILESATEVDRAELLGLTLVAMHRWWDRWTAAAGDPVRSGLLAKYRDDCITVGHKVRVELPGKAQSRGVAVGVDEQGRLLVADANGSVQPVSAGDVFVIGT